MGVYVDFANIKYSQSEVIYQMTGTPEGSAESGFMEKPGSRCEVVLLIFIYPFIFILQTISKEQDSDKELVVPDSKTDRQVNVVEVSVYVYPSYDKQWDYIAL